MSDASTGLPVRLHDEDFIAYGANNPLPVSIEESEGDEIVNYDESVNVVKNGGTASHEYTVSAGKEFQLEQVLFGGSGRARLDVEIETGVASGTFDIIATGYISTSKLSDSIEFKRALKAGAGVKVRVTKTNLDNQDFNISTSIVGLEK